VLFGDWFRPQWTVISCLMKRVRYVFVGRSWGLTWWREETALAALSTLPFRRMPTWEGTQMREIETLLLAKEDCWTRIRETRGWDELVSEMADRAARESDTMSAGWSSD